MISMEPVLRRGFTEWDRSLLPPDEFGERRRALQKLMREAGLAAVVIFSDTYHPSADFAYLAGWPMGGALLITLDQDPAVFTSDNGRGAYFQRWLTWIDDVTPAAGRIAAAVAEALRLRGVIKGRVGLAGADSLSESAYASLRKSASDYELREADSMLASLRARKRPREALAIGAAYRIALNAGSAAQRAFLEGGTNAAAALAAERSARLARARDIRTLGNLSGAGLRPYEGRPARREAELRLWLAVDYHGYWADVAIAAPASDESPAARALEAMMASARPGATGDSIAREALSALPSESTELALSFGLGGGIGLSLCETPMVRPRSEDVLESGMILSLRVVAPQGERVSLAGALIEIGEQGAHALSALPG